MSGAWRKTHLFGESYVRCLEEDLHLFWVSYVRYLEEDRSFLGELCPVLRKSMFFQTPDIALPEKTSGLALHLIFDRFSPFNCYLSVVL